MSTLEFINIDHPALLKCADTLSKVGNLKYDGLFPYCYLKIHDDFIHKLFPVLFEEEDNPIFNKEENGVVLQKPGYFSEAASLTGAHISLVYPNEDKAEEVKMDLIKGIIEPTHSFEVINLIRATLSDKTIVVLKVKAPSLEKIRKSYGLSEKLNYNGWWVPFHITIAVGLNKIHL